VVIKPTNEPGRTGWVKATAYPYYLTWSIDTYQYAMKQRNLGAFKKDSKLRQVSLFQESLQTMINELLPSDPDASFLTQFWASTNQPKFVSDQITNVWKSLSDVSYNSTGTGVGLVSIEKFAPTPVDEQIQFVFTACRPVDASRRAVADQLIDGFSIAVTHKMMDDIGSAGMLFKMRTYKGAPIETNPYKYKRIRVKVDESSIIDAKVAVASTAITASGFKVARVSTRARLKSIESGSSSSSSKGDGKKKFVMSGPIVPPAAPTSMIPASTTVGGLTSPPTSDFYLVPDFIAPVLTDSGSKPLILYQVSSANSASFDPFSSFISDLSWLALHIEASGSLSSDDELRQWFPMTALVDPTTAGVDVSIQLSGTQTAVMVQALNMSLPSSTSNAAMGFSTATLAGNFSSLVGTDPTLPSSFKGYQPFHGVLMLGLTPASKGNKSNPTTATTWKLSQIFQQINVDISTMSSGATALEALLDVFQNQFDLKLFLQKGMMWFAPVENYLTVQRLEWTLETSAEQTLTNWCTDWLKVDIKIRNITLVSRRETTRVVSPEGWNLVHSHDLLAMFQLIRTKDGDPATAPVITCGLDFNLTTGSKYLTATMRMDPSTGAVNDGILDFLEWLVPSATSEFSALNSIIPQINNIKLHSISMTIIKSSTGVKVNRVVVNAEYSDPTWTGGNKKVVPLLVSLCSRRHYQIPPGFY
jgi:hypothetical protein